MLTERASRQTRFPFLAAPGEANPGGGSAGRLSRDFGRFPCYRDAVCFPAVCLQPGCIELKDKEPVKGVTLIGRRTSYNRRTRPIICVVCFAIKRREQQERMKVKTERNKARRVIITDRKRISKEWKGWKRRNNPIKTRRVSGYTSY